MLLASALPDFDLYLSFLGLPHATYTHSILIWAPAFSIAYLVFKGRFIPYIVGIGQHMVVGDLLIGEIPLFLPLYSSEIGLHLGSSGRNQMLLEVGGFFIATMVAIKNGDLKQALAMSRSNMAMLVPLLMLITLTVIFSHDTGINLVEYGFASKSVTLIAVSHILLALFLALSAGQGVRGLRTVAV